ncbi:LuxR C-terminal-related transcriptional regulator [Gloeocapsopsis dulcis]|uniref:LuxR C-terminal-related transcriptional regulator n=1 Tax=Gloeocapsopsis dulcis TaxID=2859516 RepID=UPI001F18E4DF|nr:response regulator transcription factor [Gloeocapsopsis dulcis]WNN88655.1 response regulator transcription factor [Gloeocapsopsis dulcis]
MTRVLVTAADNIVRAGLESIIRASPNLTLVNATANLNTLAAVAQDYSPDVLLIELGLSNDEMLERLLALHAISEVATVILIDDLQGDWTSEALRLGVRAILPRSATAEEIIAAVIVVSTGLVVLHPDVDFLLPILSSSSRTPTSLVQALTPREIEVLEMLAEGLGNNSIARRLSISEHTVKFHVSSIFTKLICL